MNSENLNNKGGTYNMKVPVLNITAGETVLYRGKPCIVLEHRQDGTLLMAAEHIKHPFGSSNNFAVSSLRGHLNGAYLNALTESHPDEIITRTVDLTALNGSKEYGAVECKVAPLTLDELRQYHGIIPKPGVWEWSATPWSTPCEDDNHSWVLSSVAKGGTLSSCCSRILGSRPAFLIPSALTIEVYDDEAPGNANPLAEYSRLDLVEELYRRERVVMMSALE